MDYEKIAMSIKVAIDRRPADKGAYDDLFSLCRGWEAEDFAAAHALNKELIGMCATQITAMTGITWTWRKYASGIAECWGVYTASGVNASKKNYQNFYYSDTITVNYPFAFVGTPALVADGGSTSAVNFVRKFGDTASLAKFIVVCLVDTQTSVSIKVSLHAFGRWKAA